MISATEAQKNSILKIAEKHGVTRVRLFGSMANGQAGPESDIDLLVNFDKSASLLDAIDFQQDLQRQLGCKVDVVDENALSIYMRDQILREAVSL